MRTDRGLRPSPPGLGAGSRPESDGARTGLPWDSAQKLATDR
ncbi:hypothetical protein BN2537_6397 [Streptomyces venezuelae]|nr:hypothetical protein BN2537_6397 [Streptomyces venezuelae]